MLRVKRASAGSGKTYELAKTYIKLLLTTKRQGFKRLLTADESLKENLSSIMAVTFTVKATAEMKARIVEKLADLARADEASENELAHIDYLQEFIDDFNTNRYEIARLARKALSTLLLNYSDFKVQTIDSFFQSILHTFAYEASIDDNFNMEINSDLVTAVGFDSTLDSLSENREKAATADDTLYWIEQMMTGRLSGNKWNVFAREAGDRSLYNSLISEAKNLEKEDYQKIREELDSYFSSLELPFKRVVEQLDEANLSVWRPYHETRRDAARALIVALDSAGLSPSDICGGKGTYLKDCDSDFDMLAIVMPKEVKRRGNDNYYSLSAGAARAFRDSCPEAPTAIEEVNSAYENWLQASNTFFEEMETGKERMMTWLAYREMIPALMVLLEIARRRDSYLQSINTLQISDTNHILSRIIGKDDAPFVYERMGGRLNHFLIDEFQDTSGMQWRNLKPLIDESESFDHENLIIGDAKQSIYRFRNADYTLITGLEKEFSNIKYYTTERPPTDKTKENTNYRSKPSVVDFNNYIFSNIINLTATKDSVPIFTSNIRDIYRDCLQAVPQRRRAPGEIEGYVETVFYHKKSFESEDSGEENQPLEPGFAELPERIMELRGRGYGFRDIGVLVKNHADGQKAIEVISEHNRLHPDAPIPVISEENLLVAGALSVKLVVHALEMIAQGLKRKTVPNPVLPEPIDEKELMGMLRALNTLALPSVTEAVIGRFIPAERRNAEAPFIAAFQDAVIDYCTTRSSDIGTFLKWWRQKSKTLCITSPEDSDGIRLQTIHKSKGLEYKCVIIPNANFNFTPGPFVEWRWVETEGNVARGELLPPHLPVLTRKLLLETAHAAEYEKYLEEYALDELNKMYVGFTRAVNELYVYVPRGNHDDRRAGGTLAKLLSEQTGSIDKTPLHAPLQTEEVEEKVIVRYGNVPTRDALEAEKVKEEKERCSGGTPEIMTVSSYDILRPPTENEGTDVENGEEIEQTLLFRNANPLKTIVHPDGSEETLDPRAEGTLKHRVMQMIEVEEDIDNALLKMKVEGLVTTAQIADWGREIRKAIESVRSRGWFAPGVKVYNERPIVKRGMRVHRPDRFIVTPEGDATVIDYKFGEEGSYKKQIKEYADLLRESGEFRSVNAYIWYVAEGEIVKVG